MHHAPQLYSELARDNVIILDELEFIFPRWQLDEITEMWNDGMELEEIAKIQRRDAREVFLALFHQADKNKVTRAFAYRR
jgi:hypothetical protein